MKGGRGFYFLRVGPVSSQVWEGDYGMAEKDMTVGLGKAVEQVWISRWQLPFHRWEWPEEVVRASFSLHYGPFDCADC